MHTIYCINSEYGGALVLLSIYMLRLVGTLLAVGLAFPATLIRAESVNDPFPTTAVETASEAGKEVMRAEDIIQVLSQEGGEVNYSGRMIVGDLNFFDIPPETDPKTGQQAIIVKRPLNFRAAEFKGKIASWHSWDRFKGPMDQPQVKFLAQVNFHGARFEDDVSLDAAIFQDEAFFGGAHFYKMASFTEATFIKLADFRTTQFDERALFKKTAFEDEADFAIAIFNWIAFFSDATFGALDKESAQEDKKQANFLYTRFKGDTVFTQASFNGRARFVATNFHGPAYFSKAKFKNQAWFVGGAQFDDNVTFKEAEFLREGAHVYIVYNQPLCGPPVLFSDVVFSGDAIFSGAKFHHVSFAELGTEADIGRDTVFRKRADFRGTTFDVLDLRRVIFQSETDFSGANFGVKVDLTNADLEKSSLQMDWVQLIGADQKVKLAWQDVFTDGKFDEKAPGSPGHKNFFIFLSSLEKNFKQREQLDDAGAVHYFTEDLKRLESKGWSYLSNTVILKGIYGYGVRPFHQIGVAFLLIIGFAFVYARRNVLHYDPAKEKKFPIGITDFPIGGLGKKEESDADNAQPQSWNHRFWRGLSFSWYVFTKIGYGGVYALNQYKYVVLTEWVLSLVLWVVWIINVANRFPLLHRLVTMLH
jgi:uncharacterized protein YjbI with pentapeptide repeats